MNEMKKQKKKLRDFVGEQYTTPLVSMGCKIGSSEYLVVCGSTVLGNKICAGAKDVKKKQQQQQKHNNNK